jgi:hypothetical protein
VTREQPLPTARGKYSLALLAMKNTLYVGFSKKIEVPRSGCIFIDDEVRDIPRARIFDPLKHSFSPLAGLDYRKAREIAEVLYTISPQGENTLTVRNGKRALLKARLSGERLDKIQPPISYGRAKKSDNDDEVSGMIDDLLVSPILRRVLCNPLTEFSFNPKSVIFARLNRAELGDFDALVLGLFLMAHFKGQVVVRFRLLWSRGTCELDTGKSLDCWRQFAARAFAATPTGRASYQRQGSEWHDS